jgi:hypothetical protein
MLSRVRKAVAATIVSSTMVLSMAPIASAQVVQDGLVNVNVGDVSILEDARIGVAAVVAATVCGVKVGPVVLLARRVDASGNERVVCETNAGDAVVINA